MPKKRNAVPIAIVIVVLLVAVSLMMMAIYSPISGTADQSNGDDEPSTINDVVYTKNASEMLLNLSDVDPSWIQNVLSYNNAIAPGIIGSSASAIFRNGTDEEWINNPYRCHVEIQIEAKRNVSTAGDRWQQLKFNAVMQGSEELNIGDEGYLWWSENDDIDVYWHIGFRKGNVCVMVTVFEEISENATYATSIAKMQADLITN